MYYFPGGQCINCFSYSWRYL